MKEIKLIIFIIFCILSLSISAQNKQNNENKALKYWLDSIVRIENVIEDKGGVTHNLKELGKLTFNQEFYIFNYLQPLLKEDSLLNLGHVSYVLLLKLGLNSNNIELRQKVVEEIIDKTLYPYESNSYRAMKYFNKKDYTPKACERLKEIVFEPVNSTELHLRYVERKYNRFSDENKFLAWDVKQLTKDNPERYQEVYDSIIDIRVKQSVKSYYKNHRPEDHLILGIGWLGLAEYIPQLKDLMVKYDTNKWNTKAIKYALVKLGDKEFEEEIYNKEKIKLKYLNTKRALFIFLDAMNDSSNFRGQYSRRYFSYRYWAISIVQDYILNFPEELKVLPPEVALEYKRDIPERGYKWIYENREILILDENAWKDWTWDWWRGVDLP